MEVVLETDLPFPKRSGKVRDMYDLGDKLLIVTTDRISAFDRVLPNGIPRKGEILTALSAYWFIELDVCNHFLTTKLNEMVEEYGVPNSILHHKELLDKRSMLVKKHIPIPVECIVRGFLAGSSWKTYQKSGSVCGIKLPPGLQENSPFPDPIFTPTTKAEHGHDQNITLEEMAYLIDDEQLCNAVVAASLNIYRQAVTRAFRNGIIVADTKFEWSYDRDTPILIDEVLTPDSSRFWAVDKYKLGGPIDSYDKQYVRDYLSTLDMEEEEAPTLPPDVVNMTTKKYLEAYKALTGKDL